MSVLMHCLLTFAVIASCQWMQVGSGDCPHTLFYGPNGAGKKTLILALLREIYGAGADKVLLLSVVHLQD